MSNWLNGVIGQGIASQIGACGNLGNQATNHYTAQQAAMAQQMAQRGYNVPGATGFGQAPFGQQYHPTRYMIDGVAMTFEEFIDTIYPEDCAEKTAFVLKYSE